MKVLPTGVPLNNAKMLDREDPHPLIKGHSVNNRPYAMRSLSVCAMFPKTEALTKELVFSLSTAKRRLTALVERELLRGVFREILVKGTFQNIKHTHNDKGTVN